MSRPFTLQDVAFLTSARGDRLLNQLAAMDITPLNLPRLLTELRREYDPTETSAALETAQLRRNAFDKFGAVAAHMLFTGDALEQASDPYIRAYRARELAQDGSTLIDACCSIGTDAFAFAATGIEVTALDLDPVRLAMAARNAAVLGYSVQWQQADLTEQLPPPADALFFDPARRDADGRRVFHVQAYQPPLNMLDRWQGRYQYMRAKLAPGVTLEHIQSYGGRVRFYSVNGDLKEAELTVGESAQVTEAVLFHNGQAHHYAPTEAIDAQTDVPSGWLCEPDPAVIRAGYVAHLAHDLHGTQLDDSIAYFCTADEPQSVWVRAWQILEWMPFHVKRLRALLQARGIGQVTVKKRGSPLTPEALIPQLKLKGEGSCTLVLTRLRGEPIVLICNDIAPR
ncbi:MAG: class I SAM-dependent methyltransferase [Phototrophicaceae bacterium]|jgi:SAM-dependent methyltransferase